MQREVGPAVWVAVIVATLLIVLWIGWHTLWPPLPMSREEYIKARQNARMEAIRAGQQVPNQGR